MKNTNLIFLRYEKKSIEEEKESSNCNYDTQNDFNQNIYYFINSHARELAKGFKYNIEINHLRLKDIVVCEKNKYPLLFINSQFFLVIKDYIDIFFSIKNNLELCDLNFKLFYKKIIFPILCNLKSVPDFFYSKIKFMSMLEELIITIKNLIYKYYN